MILNPYSMLIHDLGDGISSIRNGCHAMEELGALIPQLDSINYVSLSLV